MMSWYELAVVEVGIACKDIADVRQCGLSLLAFAMLELVEDVVEAAVALLFELGASALQWTGERCHCGESQFLSSLPGVRRCVCR